MQEWWSNSTFNADEVFTLVGVASNHKFSWNTDMVQVRMRIKTKSSLKIQFTTLSCRRMGLY